MPETLSGLWRQRLRWAQGGAEVFLKNLDSIWFWRHHRLWPLALEYSLSIFWAFTFAVCIALWGLNQIVTLPAFLQIAAFVPPGFTGMLLAVMCLAQFGVSLLIDRRYEARLASAMYWVIWYPLAYWMLNLFTSLAGFVKVVFGARRARARWLSPDRGIAAPTSKENA